MQGQSNHLKQAKHEIYKRFGEETQKSKMFGDQDEGNHSIVSAKKRKWEKSP